MGGKRILLVEDDAAIRQLVSDLLTDSGYQVVPARSGREGLERVKDARPDLILLDKLMPDGDGTAFATGYRKMRGRRAPIIALCAARDGREWAESIGAATYIVKPFDIDDVLRAVREHLGERA
jgi:DNA-binding response OmpR family regulator